MVSWIRLGGPRRILYLVMRDSGWKRITAGRRAGAGGGLIASNRRRYIRAAVAGDKTEGKKYAG
jgi:hypothetical protein